MFRLNLLKHQRDISFLYLKKIKIKLINRSCTNGPRKTEHKPSIGWYKNIIFNIKNSKPYKFFENKVVFSSIFMYTIRVTRMVSLIFVVHSLGYRNGLIFYAKDSRKADLEIMKSILKSTSESDVGYHDKSSPMYKRANKVGSRIITSAKSLCKEKLLEYTKLRDIEKLRLSNSVLDLVPQDHSKLEELTFQVDLWENRVSTMRGDWHYIVTKNISVNAFVTDLCPRRIFINQGLFDVINPTDDEFALILGHEVSHLILGHTESSSKIEYLLVSCQLILLSLLDPTGISSYFIDYFASEICRYIISGNSRKNESEADLLGLEITAKACYDTKLGPSVFNKIAELSPIGRSWKDSHPHPKDRHDILAVESHEPYYKNLYNSQNCNLIRSDYYESAFKWKQLIFHNK